MKIFTVRIFFRPKKKKKRKTKSEAAGEVEITCDVCKMQMLNKYWPEHKLREHNNLAWKVGDAPIVSIYYYIKRSPSTIFMFVTGFK